MIEISPCDASEVRHLLAAAEAPRCNPGGVYSIDTICAEGQCFRMVENGQLVGAYVLQGFGPELWITAAAGAATEDLTVVLDRAATYQGGSFYALMFNTARPGLVKKTLALGYTCTMRKNLK